MRVHAYHYTHFDMDYVPCCHGEGNVLSASHTHIFMAIDILMLLVAHFVLCQFMALFLGIKLTKILKFYRRD